MRQSGWDWVMKGAAFALVIALVCAFSLTTGPARSLAFAALPLLIITFLGARSRARPKEDFRDTPWDV